MQFLEGIRTPEEDISNKRKGMYSGAVLVLGIFLGFFSKIIDESAVNELPYVFQLLDVTNFLGRFGIWIFLAVCISVYSSSARSAAANVFLFFLGMVGSYYLYSAAVAGFFPRSYAMIWFAITLVSPLLGAITWYAICSSRGASSAAGAVPLRVSMLHHCAVFSIINYSNC